ncbi:phage tail tube protein [Sulfuriferula sp.]|uniref:phage tail tube protein n=1 Tax=Sulfuriferula sp. TaxID=2025307 RepID=UPI0027315B81|nr:phage tail tube protein [Sulfuriferula sp.]MDP2026448.1 phage tail tube protein [Sulfuriferula sp.]
MASSAISAQGSILQIGTATGTAKTITAAAVGNPTILTSAAHGFLNGDVVTIAGIVGTLSALNGVTLVVTNATVNTFALQYDSTGLAYTSGGTATPVTWTKISNIRDYSGFDGQATELDKTNLDSTAKEFALGLVDPGQFAVNVDRDQLDAGQLAVEAARISGGIKNFKLTLPNAKTASFTGYVKKFSAQGGVDALLKSAIDIRISGAVTWA